jgi:5-formyltetrahydrofolate cyclo-ligase
MDDAAVRDAKRAMRTRVRALRDALLPDERARASAGIMQGVLDEMGSSVPSTIAVFAAIGAEVDVTPLVPALVEMGAQVFFPRVEGDRIAFRRAVLEDLRPGTWGIPEPPASAQEAPAIDFMVVPGVAFDRACRRLGNGKAYYDRAIAELEPARTVGVCFAAQLVDEVPVGPHDAVLDAVVTESGVFRRGG